MKAILPIRISLGEDERREFMRAINFHYLGDEECNKLSEDGSRYVSKYPEKETPAFIQAVRHAAMTYDEFIEVEFCEKTGRPVNFKKWEEA